MRIRRRSNARKTTTMALNGKPLHITTVSCNSACEFKDHFQPWCKARRDPISLNTKFPDHWKPSKIVFLKSHPGHIVNCFTVNTFALRHFTVSLQYFEFCPEESEENFFKCHAWISSYSVNRVGGKDNVQIFSLSRCAWGFLMKIKYFQ